MQPAPLGRFLQNKLSAKTAAELGIDRRSLNKTERLNLSAVLQSLKGVDLAKEKWVADISGSKAHKMKGISPTLTKSRAQSKGFWLTWLNRKMTTEEILKLQGIDPDIIPPGVVSERQVRGAAGNSIPIPLLARLLKQVLTAMGHDV